jgi:hypothetical protein
VKLGYEWIAQIPLFTESKFPKQAKAGACTTLVRFVVPFKKIPHS